MCLGGNYRPQDPSTVSFWAYYLFLIISVVLSISPVLWIVLKHRRPGVKLLWALLLGFLIWSLLLFVRGLIWLPLGCSDIPLAI